MILLHMILIYSAGIFCEIPIPAGRTWTGNTTNGSGNVYGMNDHITLTQITGSTWMVSDFSAGYFEEFGYGTDYPLTFQINCYLEVEPDEWETDFGNCSLTGGSYDSLDHLLRLKWKIPDNFIEEESVFRLK